MSIALSALCIRVSQPVANSRFSRRLRAALMLAVFALLALNQSVAHAMPVAPSTATVVPAINTIAGGGGTGGTFSGDGAAATSANLNTPEGVAMDSAGNLYISDSGNNRIRVVAAVTGTILGQSLTAGEITTVAGGGGTPGTFSGDGAAALS